MKEERYLLTLKHKHAQLDHSIKIAGIGASSDEFMVKNLKKCKLLLKEKITKIEIKSNLN